MKTSKLDYYLPPELIAPHPASPRDSARMMVISRRNGKIIESIFRNLDDYLNQGDVLVFNKSKVFPARTYADLNSKKIEVLFLEEKTDGLWEVLIGGRVKDGDKLDFGHGFQGTVIKKQGTYLGVALSKEEIFDFLNKYGQVPLPPYIKRKATAKDAVDYQNVFAEKYGSAAAPTAGMHFTQELIDRLKNKGVEVHYVTLHVGLGTFAPIKADRVEEHRIHREYYEIGGKTKRDLLKAKREGRRIIACGTTSLRVLESLSESNGPESDYADIFIHPGYQFRWANGLITNFHTPKSSLLALVWAFGGERNLKKAYRLAIKRRYRFFSYGDGMIII